MLDDHTILKYVIEAPSPQAACDALVSAANAAGGDDNITVIIVQVVQP
jgi:protein phosphatase